MRISKILILKIRKGFIVLSVVTMPWSFEKPRRKRERERERERRGIKGMLIVFVTMSQTPMKHNTMPKNKIQNITNEST